MENRDLIDNLERLYRGKTNSAVSDQKAKEAASNLNPYNILLKAREVQEGRQ